MFDAIWLTFLIRSGAKVCNLFRSHQELSNEYFIFTWKNRLRYRRTRAIKGYITLYYIISCYILLYYFFFQANPQSTHSLGRPTPASAPTLAKVTGRPHHTRTWNTRGDERDLITRTDSRLSHEKKIKLIRSFKEPAPPYHSTRPGPVRTRLRRSAEQAPQSPPIKASQDLGTP